MNTYVNTSPRTFAERLRDGDQLVGGLLRIPGEEIVEMCAVAGFDFVVVDCEHGPSDVVPLRQHIVAAQAHGMAVLVRVGQGENSLILRALDHGADGIVGPHVDEAADAEALVRATHYPPLGRRGFATYSRAGSFGTKGAAEHRQSRTSEVVLIAMLESPRAAVQADRILAVQGVDGYLIGPADLAMSRSDEDKTVAELTLVAHEHGRRSAAVRADIVSTISQAAAARGQGASLVIYNLTHLMMQLLKDAAQIRETSRESS